MIERTLALVKPNGVKYGIVDIVKQRYIGAGLRLVRERVQTMDERLVLEFYREHDGKFFFESLVRSMSNGPSVALLLEGEDAIQLVRRLNGATDPVKADPGTIRYDFLKDYGLSNAVHGSDSPEAVLRELRIIFGDTT